MKGGNNMNFKDYFRGKRNSKKGFNLVEMMAVIAILAIASTATISVFLAVQTTVRDTSKLTTQQFTTTQVERFFRDQLQIASNVDIYLSDPSVDGDFVPDFENGLTTQKDDEYIYLEVVHKDGDESNNDPNNLTGRLHFVKYTDGEGNTRGLLTVDDVEEVSITICPLNYDAYLAGEDIEDMNLKLMYKIKTKNYTYSGGIVMGNAFAADSGELRGNFSNWNHMFPDNEFSASLNWGVSGDSENDTCLFFHAVASGEELEEDI